MSKKFAYTDCYCEADILHFAYDHLSAANTLFEVSPRYFDSAGYLIHLGIELLLKALHLHLFKGFEKTHKLRKLYDDLLNHNSKYTLLQEHVTSLEMIDNFYNLRYQSKINQIEIGDDDLDRINALIEAIHNLMPKSIITDFEKVFCSKTKGGRILMKKKK